MALMEILWAVYGFYLGLRNYVYEIVQKSERNGGSFNWQDLGTVLYVFVGGLLQLIMVFIIVILFNIIRMLRPIAPAGVLFILVWFQIMIFAFAAFVALRIMTI